MEALAASDSNRAYVVMLEPGSHLRWGNSGAYTDSEYARLKREIEARGNRKLFMLRYV